MLLGYFHWRIFAVLGLQGFVTNWKNPVPKPPNIWTRGTPHLVGTHSSHQRKTPSIRISRISMHISHHFTPTKRGVKDLGLGMTCTCLAQSCICLGDTNIQTGPAWRPKCKYIFLRQILLLFLELRDLCGTKVILVSLLPMSRGCLSLQAQGGCSSRKDSPDSPKLSPQLISHIAWANGWRWVEQLANPKIPRTTC